MCALNSEEIELKCHTFLSVYIKSVTYGRNSTLGKELCDGEKPRDKKAPALSCYDENFNLNLLSDLDNVCLAVITALNDRRPKVGLWLLKQRIQAIEQTGIYTVLLENILITAVRRGAEAIVDFLKGKQ